MWLISNVCINVPHIRCYQTFPYYTAVIETIIAISHVTRILEYLPRISNIAFC